MYGIASEDKYSSPLFTGYHPVGDKWVEEEPQRDNILQWCTCSNCSQWPVILIFIYNLQFANNTKRYQYWVHTLLHCWWKPQFIGGNYADARNCILKSIKLIFCHCPLSSKSPSLTLFVHRQIVLYIKPTVFK